MALEYSPDSLDNDILYQALHLSVKCEQKGMCFLLQRPSLKSAVSKLQPRGHIPTNYVWDETQLHLFI